MTAIADFHEIQFPADLTDGRGGQGYRGGPLFSTAVQIAESGKEQRNMNWLREVRKYNVGHIVRDKAATAILLDFFNGRAGMRYGFRFKDWLDFQVWPPTPASTITSYSIGVGGSGYAVGDTGVLNVIYWDGQTVNDATYLVASVDGSGAVTSFTLTNGGSDYYYIETMPTLTGGAQPGSGTGFTVSILTVAATPSPGSIWSPSGGAPYQLVKIYTDAGGYRHMRFISKLCTGIVADATGYMPPVPKFYLNAALVTLGTDYDVDYDTGLFWPSTDHGLAAYLDPSSGVTLTWGGDFDVPARFLTDVQRLLLQNFGDTDWPTIEISEIKMQGINQVPPVTPLPVGLGPSVVRLEYPPNGGQPYAEGGPSAVLQFAVRLNGPAIIDLTVSLSSSNAGVATVPSSVVVTAASGNSFGTFNVTLVGAGTATITAGSATATVKCI
jgi:hypothetical protein